MNVDFVRRRGRVNSGRERYIVCMFVDMRGSTKFAEKRLPFDVVFIVNRFLGAASQAAVDAGGQPNQFVGDGLGYCFRRAHTLRVPGGEIRFMIVSWSETPLQENTEIMSSSELHHLSARPVVTRFPEPRRSELNIIETST